MEKTRIIKKISGKSPVTHEIRKLERQRGALANLAGHFLQLSIVAANIGRKNMLTTYATEALTEANEVSVAIRDFWKAYGR